MRIFLMARWSKLDAMSYRRLAVFKQNTLEGLYLRGSSLFHKSKCARTSCKEVLDQKYLDYRLGGCLPTAGHAVMTDPLKVLKDLAESATSWGLCPACEFHVVNTAIKLRTELWKDLAEHFELDTAF